jgi:hypothetical protein
MKKMLAWIIIPYLVVVGVAFYIFFGPALTARYRTLEWKDVGTFVPEGFKVKTYHSKGWDVYYMEKIFSSVKIAVRPVAVNVSRLPEGYRKVMFRYASRPDEIYFVASAHKSFEVVYARMIEGATVFISVKGGSVFSGRYVVDKIAGSTYFKGVPLEAPRPSIPLKHYWTDLVFVIGMLLPILIIYLIFYISGRRPAEKHFEGDPIVFEEGNMYYRSIRKYRRQSSFCYLVLTTTRLMVFAFRKPVWESRIYEEKPAIKIEGKNIILQKDDIKFVLKSARIEKWKEHLNRFLY